MASDDPDDLNDEVARIEASLMPAFAPASSLVNSGARVMYKQYGANLPPPLSGHEHFGYLDGVSQPGVRGRVSDDPNDVFMLRQNPNKRDNKTKTASGEDVGDVAQGKPGQDMLWPGQFVFGYFGQDPQGKEIDKRTKDNISAGPDWTVDGSFLVFRRLRQDVAGFHQFLHDKAKELKLPDPPHASGPRLLGSKLVGRWHSGTPAMRTAADEFPDVGDNDCVNNAFEFQDESKPIPNPPIKATTPLDCRDPVGAPSDPDPTGKRGEICPFSAHIRKVYPRDDVPLDRAPGSPDPCDARNLLNEVDTQTHRILRRGIPYGPVSESTPDAPKPDDVDRGLLFLCYQTSIQNQFEFVQACWANNLDCT